jgi:hypothetical protein
MTGRRRPGSPGSLAVAGRQLRRVLRTRALRPRRLPRTASPPPAATGPAATSPVLRGASWSRPSGIAQGAPGAGRKFSSPERRALSGSAPPASTVLRIRAAHGRAFGAPLTRSLYRPSGPDGEGQARGQARNARGEPPQLTLVAIGRPGQDDGPIWLRGGCDVAELR